MLPDEAVVVDLPVDGEHDALVGIGEWLRSALYLPVSRRSRSKEGLAGPTNADDTEPLMAQYCTAKASVSLSSLVYD